jgi:hypothetical protein
MDLNMFHAKNQATFASQLQREALDQDYGVNVNLVLKEKGSLQRFFEGLRITASLGYIYLPAPCV